VVPKIPGSGDSCHRPIQPSRYQASPTPPCHAEACAWAVRPIAAASGPTNRTPNIVEAAVAAWTFGHDAGCWSLARPSGSARSRRRAVGRGGGGRKQAQRSRLTSRQPGRRPPFAPASALCESASWHRAFSLVWCPARVRCGDRSSGNRCRRVPVGRCRLLARPQAYANRVSSIEGRGTVMASFPRTVPCQPCRARHRSIRATDLLTRTRLQRWSCQDHRAMLRLLAAMQL